MSAYQHRKSHFGDKTIKITVVLSPQWGFLYWEDNIFILNQNPGSRQQIYIVDADVLAWNKTLGHWLSFLQCN